MMASRGRYQPQEWEREEFDNTFDAQYLDEETQGGVQLDHCKLYVTNISRALNEEGLTTAFSKYGTLVKVHVSRDPAKRYALITYETPGEAKLAMMKLNKTEPLRLNINIAHKKSNQDSRESREDTRKMKPRESNSYRDDASVSSKGRRKPDEFTNGNVNELDDPMNDDDLGLDEVLDTELELELTQLRFQQLKLQQAQLRCKQQMLLLNKGKKSGSKSSRCILPDGRIVVRNTSDKSDQPDNTYSSAAGDSLTLPSLQRLSSRTCLSCGGVADLYCGNCGLAPYCSQRCQQSDWNRRHKHVCHNLACSTTSELKVKETVDAGEPDSTSTPAPLRQPHSSNRRDYKADVNNKTKKNFNQKQTRNNGSFQNKNMRRPGRRDDNEESPERAGNKRDETINHISNKLNTKPETKQETKPKPDDKPRDKEPPKPPASLQDVTPKTRTIVPKEYLLDKLSLNETVLLSVESEAAGGFICLTLHEANEHDYQLLCGEFGEECEGREAVFPSAGDLFALYYSEERAWYRARRLSGDRVALIDCSRVVNVTTNDRMVDLPPEYLQVPECCCQLNARGVQVGDNLKCTLVSKTSDGFKVSLRNAETDAAIGDGEVTRWRPAVQYEVDKTSASIPEVPRPSLSNMAAVFLVQNTGLDMFVRPAESKLRGVFERIIQDGVAAGMKALPLKDPPRAGQTVLCQHTDGHYYRGLCKRTNFKKNKYMIEFIEYGNTVISELEKLSPCPEELDVKNTPTPVALVRLDMETVLNEKGQQYLEKIRDDEVELVVNCKDKSVVIQSGSVVELVEMKTKESVTRKLEMLCSPEWKKIEQNGGDVVDCEPLMYSSLKYYDLPSAKCELCVLDISTIRGGALGVCDATIGHEQRLEAVTEQIEAYVKSDLGKDPYLPKIEELCLAPCPPYPQYFRAVLCNHTAGSSEATVCYVDYNNVDTVEVKALRKMMREFTNTPALACHAEIRGFPANPSDSQLARALQYMKIDDQGRGQLTVEKCEKVDPGFYIVEAPGLLAAMMQS
ncbi:uncharacterized protein LOC116778337 isoform X5 [Danaus plexippus]|uniref:uncharacterized protein LOC116778337 isoform X5 n=1 Tax=Danaus plexippus TaxID=13037 RepID=UPI002AB0DB3C|nr:uncharacterized protein LOC116778337 isoform X5 [Danaus plexippus]